MKRINISSGEDAFTEAQPVNYDYTHNLEVQAPCGSNSNVVALHPSRNNLSSSAPNAAGETHLRAVH